MSSCFLSSFRPAIFARSKSRNGLHLLRLLRKVISYADLQNWQENLAWSFQFPFLSVIVIIITIRLRLQTPMGLFLELTAKHTSLRGIATTKSITLLRGTMGMGFSIPSLV
ncbi:hypothetical protein FR483_n097L [Paramecium bursaria Chlorella virus FR483]|uniref:Uncharacterized protein n097L n=1 Tax=Paramecium bursaria Chlorella virus FR483 TaxID=399781 RepID=A7J6F1_PBCVF|nr:hypothetical protein FR483_n097L [Paramecium bursaria Chlorella virus FR483]ABT15382.1 hypothetical protein FR483_n097L [Paramecium bursaria Chlorella virus FR483]